MNPGRMTLRSTRGVTAAFVALTLAFVAYGCARQTAAPTAPHTALEASQQWVDVSGQMRLPDNLEHWVHLGSSLGMQYSETPFDPQNPGSFQIVMMEPTAYAEFERTNEFPEGSMFALVFYDVAQAVPPNREGFVMGNASAIEIHYKNRTLFPENGFNFYMFEPGMTAAQPALTAPNSCISCHSQNGAHDATFTQFYPYVRARLAAAGVTPAPELPPPS